MQHNKSIMYRCNGPGIVDLSFWCMLLQMILCCAATKEKMHKERWPGWTRALEDLGLIGISLNEDPSSEVCAQGKSLRTVRKFKYLEFKY